MRSPNFGVIPDLINNLNKGISLEIFRRMCKCRYFDLELVNKVKDGFVSSPVYLSIGQESIASSISMVIPDFMIFAQHRCHATYLSFGGDPEKLRDELLGLPTGTSGGRAGSNCIQCHENNITMFGHHGLIGENVPVGVGAALGSGKPVVCLFGDGAAEEDYVLAAIGFAATHKLPVFFVCEDNNLSILTTTDVRRSWKITDIAKAFGIPAIDVSDDPWSIHEITSGLKRNLPAFINIYTCRANWHVGVGVDGPPEWDRLSIVREELEKMGLSNKSEKIEKDIIAEMGKLWDKEQLQKLLKR